MKFLDPEDPFFGRPWVRWATVILPTGWGIAEFVWMGAPMWGTLFVAAGAYAFWALILSRKGG